MAPQVPERHDLNTIVIRAPLPAGGAYIFQIRAKTLTQDMAKALKDTIGAILDQIVAASTELPAEKDDGPSIEQQLLAIPTERKL